MHHAQSRVRMAIVDVLDQHSVLYEGIRKRRHPALRFAAGGQTRTIIYSSGGDLREHLNARSQARCVLRDLGLQPTGQA